MSEKRQVYNFEIRIQVIEVANGVYRPADPRPVEFTQYVLAESAEQAFDIVAAMFRPQALAHDLESRRGGGA